MSLGNSLEVRLRYLANFNPSVPAQVRIATEQEATFVPMEAIHEFGGFDRTRVRHIGALLSGYSYFENGDIAYAKVTPCFENGKIMVLENLENGFGFGTTEVTVVRPNRTIGRRYLFYVLLEDGFKQHGKAAMTGAGGLKRVPENFTKNFRVWLPNLPKQQAITDYLDHEIAEIDAFIADQEELIILLRERRTAAITHAVTKGLNPKAPMKDSGVEWLGEVPEHWEVRPSKSVFALRNERERPGDVHLTPSQTHGVMPQSQYMEVTGNRVVLALAGTTMKHVAKDDFVIHLRSFQGGIEWSNYSGKVSPAYTVLRPRVGVIPAYFRYCLKSRGYIERIASLTDQLRDGQSMRYYDFGKSPLPLPPIDEQKEIASFIDYEIAEIDAVIMEAREAIALSRERRGAVISAAVTGKLDVRGLAPAATEVEAESVGVA